MKKKDSDRKCSVRAVVDAELADVLQMYCMGGGTTAIRVISGGIRGTMYLVEGEVRHAEAGDLVGEAAFDTMLERFHEGFECMDGALPETFTMKVQWQHLITNGDGRNHGALIRAGDHTPEEAGGKKIVYPLSAPLPDRGIRVLIVDDSRLMRKALAADLEGDDFIVVGKAANGVEALELISQVRPDVITMDMNMPVMDGLSALKRIMIEHRIPTIMVSAFTHEGATVTFDALRYGAVDFISKVSQGAPGGKFTLRKQIREKVRLASRMSVEAVRYIRAEVNENGSGLKDPRLEYVVSMGAGEGGYGSLLKIIPRLTPDLPAAFLVVLYAAPCHVEAFARYLHRHSLISVKRAKTGDLLHGGTCYLTSGEEYMIPVLTDGQPMLHITPSSFPGRRGSVNILMLSLAEQFGACAAGAVLSGASTDGAEGVNEIFNAGGEAFVQDPHTCLMNEMPQAAIEACSNVRVVSDDNMAAELIRRVRSHVDNEAAK